MRLWVLKIQKIEDIAMILCDTSVWSTISTWMRISSAYHGAKRGKDTSKRLNEGTEE